MAEDGNTIRNGKYHTMERDRMKRAGYGASRQESWTLGKMIEAGEPKSKPAPQGPDWSKIIKD